MTNTIESLPVQANPEELQVQPQVLELEHGEKVINLLTKEAGIADRTIAPECCIRRDPTGGWRPFY